MNPAGPSSEKMQKLAGSHEILPNDFADAHMILETPDVDLIKVCRSWEEVPRVFPVERYIADWSVIGTKPVSEIANLVGIL